jgi:hypothetical protein
VTEKATEQTQGKGRPTPKRRDVEKRRGGPVAPPPTNRREAAKALRAKQAVDRQRGRSASPGRSEGVLLTRDQGPVRRLVRDLVDSRRNLGGLLMPAAALSIGSFFTKDQQVLAAISGVFVATLVGVALDTVLLSSLIRRRLRADFPDEGKVSGHVFYGVLRSTVIRRFRMPKPQVTRGTRL